MTDTPHALAQESYARCQRAPGCFSRFHPRLLVRDQFNDPYRT